MYFCFNNDYNNYVNATACFYSALTIIVTLPYHLVCTCVCVCASLTFLCMQAVFETDPKLSHAPMVQCCVLSNIESSHRRPIYDIHWMPPQLEVSSGVRDLCVSMCIYAHVHPLCLQLITSASVCIIMCTCVV